MDTVDAAMLLARALKPALCSTDARERQLERWPLCRIARRAEDGRGLGHQKHAARVCGCVRLARGHLSEARDCAAGIRTATDPATIEADLDRLLACVSRGLSALGCPVALSLRSRRVVFADIVDMARAAGPAQIHRDVQGWLRAADVEASVERLMQAAVGAREALELLVHDVGQPQGGPGSGVEVEV